MIRNKPIDRTLPSLRLGLSLLELLATLVIMGVLASVVIPRLSNGVVRAKGGSCTVNAGVIEVQVALWKRAKGSWPNASLKDIGSDPEYFPDGLPTCPVDNSAYQIDAATGRLMLHKH